MRIEHDSLNVAFRPCQPRQRVHHAGSSPNRMNGQSKNSAIIGLKGSIAIQDIGILFVII